VFPVIRPRLVPVVLAFALGSLTTLPTASPAWEVNGNPICTAAGVQQLPHGIADGAGGYYLVWLDARGGNRPFAQHLQSDGSIAPGWPADGLALTTIGGASGRPKALPDGTGGLLVVFALGGVRAQRVGANGVLAPGFPPDGKLIPTPFGVGSTAVPDGAGGAYFMGSLAVGCPFEFGCITFRIARIDANGNIAPGWTSNGVTVTFSDAPAGGFALEPNPSGGVIWAGSVRADLQTDMITGLGGRVRANGTIAQSIGLTSTVSGGLAPGISNAYATTNGLNGILATWRDTAPFQPPQFLGQVDDSGARWDSSSVLISWPIPDAQGGPLTPIADGTGGGYLLGKPLAQNSLYAFRHNANGSYPAGWTSAGIPLSTPEASAAYSIRVASGALVVCWSERFTGGNFDIRAVVILPSGSVAANWPPGGATLCSAIGDQNNPQLVMGDGGGAIAVWEDLRDNAVTGANIYAGPVLPVGAVAVQASLTEATAEPGRVLLRWFSPDGDRFTATLERQRAGSGFVALADLRADASGLMSHEDREVVAGETYDYRLAVIEDGVRRALGEVRLQIPDRLTLALEGARPNPSSGPFTLAFVLPSAEIARLDLHDVSGRRVWSREIAGTAGRHVVPLGDALAPGIYVARLAQGGRSVTSRVVRAE